jgi:hypothetical protein
MLRDKIEKVIELHFPNFIGSDYLMDSVIIDMNDRHESDESDDTIFMYIEDNI